MTTLSERGKPVDERLMKLLSGLHTPPPAINIDIDEELQKLISAVTRLTAAFERSGIMAGASTARSDSERHVLEQNYLQNLVALARKAAEADALK